MKRLALHLLRLYPRAWRRRYGLELEALLDELDIGPAELTDLLVGAMSAHAHGFKENTTMKRISPAALVAVALMPLIIAVALLLLLTEHMTEPGGEFMVLFAPLLIVGLMGPLSATYPAESVGLNRATRLLGLGSAVAVGALALMSIVVSILNSPATPIPFMTELFVVAAAGLAMWFVLNGWLVLRGGEMPAVLGLLGMLNGVLSLIIFVTSNSSLQAVLPRPAFTNIMSIVTPLWLVSLPVWALWSAAWLWVKREKSPRTTAVGSV